MKRRELLKAIGIGAVIAPVVVNARDGYPHKDTPAVSVMPQQSIADYLSTHGADHVYIVPQDYVMPYTGVTLPEGYEWYALGDQTTEVHGEMPSTA